MGHPAFCWMPRCQNRLCWRGRGCCRTLLPTKHCHLQMPRIAWGGPYKQEEEWRLNKMILTPQYLPPINIIHHSMFSTHPPPLLSLTYIGWLVGLVLPDQMSQNDRRSHAQGSRGCPQRDSMLRYAPTLDRRSRCMAPRRLLGLRRGLCPGMDQYLTHTLKTPCIWSL